MAPCAERRADGAVHILGLLAVAAGVVVLAQAAFAAKGWHGVLGTVPYLAGLVASFSCSAAYNMAPPGRAKDRLRPLDHAAIYLLIAGTYTSVLPCLDNRWSRPLLVVVWAGAAAGVALKLGTPGQRERLGLALYLLLGWVGVVALLPLAAALSATQLALLGGGGLLYTGGVLFHLAHRLRFHDAAWHAAVLAASICHYLLVLALVRA